VRHSQRKQGETDRPVLRRTAPVLDPTELKTLFGAGLQLEAPLGDFETQLTLLHDVSGEHDGQDVEFSLLYPTELAGFELHPEVNLTWMSDKRVDYFYGVSKAESRAGRPAYSPGSSFEIGLELLVQRPIFDNFSLVAVVGVRTFGSEITDSPLVDEDYEVEGAIGFMFTF